MKEMVGGCCVCSDERGWDENPLVYCDGPSCNVAVHQACYGIVAVPSGPWFCKKCESSERSAGRVRCELCPSRDGAFKKTDNGSWAHVVCALYIPEVRFENVSTMEKILISLIPQERYNKTCYICEERGDKKELKAGIGACMQCNKPGCKQYFHVTCAQMMGLLCEEAGNMMDNVKYCGYCQHHYSKLKRTSNLKIIPPFKPIPSGSTTDSPTSSPEKNNGKGLTPPSGSEIPTSQIQSAGTALGLIADNTLKSASGSKNSSKKSSGNGKASSVSSGSSNGSSSHKNSASSSSIPRIQIQPSNLFTSSGGFSSYSALLNPNANGNGNSSTGKRRSKSRSPSTDEAPSVIKSEKSSGSNGGGKNKSYGGGMSNDEEMEDNHKTSTGDGNSSKGLKQGQQDSSSSFISSTSFGGKHKDLATVSVKEVLSSALDKPISSTGSKFDRSGSSAALTSGISEAYGNISGSGRNIDKPPPEIVPHVTLTPIPMKSNEESQSKMENRSSRSKSPASFPSTFGQVGKLEPMETEMATLEKTSPSKRMRMPLHSSPPQQFDSDTESATEEWAVTEEDASRSQSNSHNMSPQKEHLSRRDQGQGKGNAARRMLTATQVSEMSNWESRKSPTVFLERVSVPIAPPPPITGTNKEQQREGPVPFPFGSTSAYPLNFAPRKRGPGRPTLNKGQGGRGGDEESRGKGPGGKRGKRGGNVTNYNRRDTLPNGSSGGMLDDNAGDGGKMDEGETNDGPTGSGRGGRQPGLGRKGSAPPASTITASTSLHNSPTVSRKQPNYDDAPTLTMSQLKAQMAVNSASSTPEKNASLAPQHMFGNALNPASSMAQRMVDTLSQEMETIAASSDSPQASLTNVVPPLVGIPLPGKSSSSGVGGPKVNGVVVTNGATTAGVLKPQQPQTLEELLERQWEQGSQFLMEQAQHLDISQLLSCLNQLKADNKALEDHVQSLYQRKDQLTAINARLSNPLGSTNTLGLGLGFNPNTGRQETPPVPPAIQQSKQPPVPPPPPGHHQQQQHPHIVQQQQQEGSHQGSRYASSHKYPGYEPAGSHGYPPPPVQGHHRGPTGSVTSQSYGYPGGSSSGQGSSVSSTAHPSHHPSHSHQQVPPRDSR